MPYEPIVRKKNVHSDSSVALEYKECAKFQLFTRELFSSAKYLSPSEVLLVAFGMNFKNHIY